MKKRLLSAALALALAVACLTGCGAASEEKTVAKALGLEKLPAVTHISSCDSHGGFHGDGVSCIALTFEDDQLEQQLAADPAWNSLPADETVQDLLAQEGAGVITGPCLTDGDGQPLVPPVEKGCYRLIDRHSDQQGDILSRGSFNFTVGVYDAEARVLYCCELDT